jgi:hypothetical protein
MMKQTRPAAGRNNINKQESESAKQLERIEVEPAIRTSEISGWQLPYFSLVSAKFCVRHAGKSRLQPKQ